MNRGTTWRTNATRAGRWSRTTKTVTNRLGDLLDLAYLRRWAAELGVENELGRLLPERQREQ